MMIIKAFIVVSFLSFIYQGCCSCTVSNSFTGVSEKLKDKSYEYVISKTGKDFFNQYIKINNDKITKIKDGYLMVYNFSIPEKEGINGEIRFSIDSVGNIKKDKEIVGIPDCISNQENCNFNISKTEAINIAKQKGFEKGIKDWEVNFVWNSELETYNWQIITTLSEIKNNDFTKSSGKIMLINPDSGNVIKTEEWRVN